MIIIENISLTQLRKVGILMVAIAKARTNICHCLLVRQVRLCLLVTLYGRNLNGRQDESVIW